MSIKQEFGQNLHFAPIGLLDMYNSGGAVEAVSYVSERTIKIYGKGCGRFGAYSSTKPNKCMVDNQEENFTYSSENGLLTITLHDECNLREIEFTY